MNDRLDELVWQQVVELLAHPVRLKSEYERQLGALVDPDLGFNASESSTEPDRREKRMQDRTRRKRAALRRPAAALLDHAIDQRSRIQIRPKQPDNRPIHNPPA